MSKHDITKKKPSYLFLGAKIQESRHTLGWNEWKLLMGKRQSPKNQLMTRSTDQQKAQRMDLIVWWKAEAHVNTRNAAGKIIERRKLKFYKYELKIKDRVIRVKTQMETLKQENGPSTIISSKKIEKLSIGIRQWPIVHSKWIQWTDIQCSWEKNKKSHWMNWNSLFFFFISVFWLLKCIKSFYDLL